jgi:hypothetical protein
MQTIGTQVETYAAIVQQLAAGHATQALRTAEAALQEAREEEELYEEWAARQEEASKAWNTHGAQLLRDLTGAEPEEIPW